MRTSSQEAHKKAESSPFVTDLMRGSLSLADYGLYLGNLAYIYEELEKQTSTNPPLPSSEQIWDSRLNRSDRIENDLHALGLSNWRESVVPTTGTRDYVARLTELEGRSDARTIAHHYTRYLGDLSGGQAISALVARNYGATDQQLTFYKFPELENLVRYKDSYREVLDNLEISDIERAALIEEVSIAFELNQRMFEDLYVAS